VIAAGGLDLVQAATSLHGGNGRDRSPKVCEMAAADQFASFPEKPLAKRWKSSDLGHLVFPPRPSLCPNKEGVLTDKQQGWEDHFSSNNSRASGRELSV
jgi:hypothetical protein